MFGIAPPPRSSWLEEQRQLAGLEGPLTGVAFAPRGENVAAVSESGKVRVWRKSDGLVLQTFDFPHGKPAAIAFTGNGNALAVGGERGGEMWNTSSWKSSEIAAWKALSAADEQPSIAFLAPLNHTSNMICGGDCASYVWFDERGLRSGGGTIPAGKLPLRSAAKQLDRTQMALGVQGDIIVHHQAVTNFGEQTARTQTLSGHTDAVIALAYSPDLKYLASGSLDRSLRLWNAEDGKEQETVSLPSEVVGVVFSADSQNLLVATKDGEIATYVVPSLVKKRSRKLDPPAEIRGLAVTADGQTLATAESNGRVRLWRWDPALPAGKDDLSLEAPLPLAPAGEPPAKKNWIALRKKLTGLKNDVAAVAFGADNKRVAAVDGLGWINIWNVEGPECEKIPFQQGKPICLAFLTLETLVVGGAEGLTIYDLTTRTDTEVARWQEFKRSNVVSVPRVILPTTVGFSVAADAPGWIDYSSSGTYNGRGWQPGIPDHIVSLSRQ